MKYYDTCDECGDPANTPDGKCYWCDLGKYERESDQPDSWIGFSILLSIIIILSVLIIKSLLS